MTISTKVRRLTLSIVASSRRLDADVVVVVVVNVDADASTNVLGHGIQMTIDKIRSTSLRAREKQTGIRDAR